MQLKIKSNWKNYVIGILILIIVGGIAFLSGASFSSQGMVLGDMGYLAESALVKGVGVPISEGFAPQVEERKVTRNANLDLETRDFDKSSAQIKNLMNENDVVVLTESVSKYKDDYRIAYYNIRIEEDKLDGFLESAKLFGEVLEINVYATDVTESFVDYSDRLERYKLQMQRYEAILEREDLEVSDEIDIQQRMDSLEVSIAYLEKSISEIEKRVEYSSVSVSLKEKPSVLSELDFLGLREGFVVFMGAVENAIKLVLIVVGFLIPFGIVYGVYRLFRRKKK